MRLLLLLFAFLLLIPAATLNAEIGKVIVAGTFYKADQAKTRNDQLKKMLRSEPEASLLYQQGRYRYTVKHSGRHSLSVLHRFNDIEDLLSVLSSIRKIYPDAYIHNATGFKKPLETEPTKPPVLKAEPAELSHTEKRIMARQAEQSKKESRPTKIVRTEPDDTIVVVDETTKRTTDSVQQTVSAETVVPDTKDEVQTEETSEEKPAASDSSAWIYAVMLILLAVAAALVIMLRRKKKELAPLQTPEPVMHATETQTPYAQKSEPVMPTIVETEPETPAAPEPLTEPETETEPVAIEEPVQEEAPAPSVSPRKKRGLPTHTETITKDHLTEFAGNRILVAEDNLINQKVLTKLLEESGIELVMANNGQEALDILAKDQNFGMVLMDAHMPVKDGFEATREIRRNILYEPIAVVALSGDVGSDDIRKMKEAGMEEQLAKPLRVEALYDVLYQYLDLAEEILEVTTDESPEPEAPVQKALYPTEGIEICGGDKSMYMEILNEFVQTYQHADRLVETYLKANDEGKIVALMLDIRGVAGNIGAIALSYAAEMLREAILANEISNYPALQDSFNTNLKNLLEAIEAFTTAK